MFLIVLSMGDEWVLYWLRYFMVFGFEEVVLLEMVVDLCFVLEFVVCYIVEW